MDLQEIKEKIGKRERKYKAYIKEFGKVFDVITLHAKLEDEDFHRVFINKPIEEGEVKNYRIDGVNNFLLDCTGRKNNHGKELYEGDIIECVAENKQESGVFYVARDSQDSSWSAIEKGSKHGLHLWWGGWKEMERIGNIFENPELLQD